MIHSSTISNNTSESRAGGIKLESTPGPFTTTIHQGTVISGNTSLGTGAGISEGGGLDISTLGSSTTTLTNVTITGNDADDPADGGGKGGGIFNSNGSPENGTLNVSLSRIAGNTAPTGSGLFRFSGTVTAVNNWWGCDNFPGSGAGPDVNGCDTVSGTANFTPRLDLVVTATPSTIVGGGTSSVKADVSKNSAGAAVIPVVLNGLTIDFLANNGTMSPPSAPLASFMATSTYNNTSCPGPATVMAGLDNGTDTALITVNCPPMTTTTTLPPPPPVTCNGLPATIVGTNSGESITGTPGNDVIVGRGGNDRIDGRGGHDKICGNEGNDRIRGSDGNDMLSGDGGNDDLDGGTGNDRLEGGTGNDKLFGGNNNDTLDGGPNADFVRGGSGFDTCINRSGDNVAQCEA